MAVAAMISPGCSCGDDTSTNTSTSTTTTTTTTSSGGGEGGSMMTGGGGGQGGQGGTMMGDQGVQATETVTAGQSVSSPNYRMVFTFGQPTQNQGTTTSPSYRLQGGLIGANGSAP
jgi:hypothetical protein